MAYAQLTLGVALADGVFEVGNFTRFLVGGDVLLSIHDGNAGAVVAPVFQPFEAFNQQGRRLTIAHIGYDSTHKE